MDPKAQIAPMTYQGVKNFMNCSKMFQAWTIGAFFDKLKSYLGNWKLFYYKHFKKVSIVRG